MFVISSYIKIGRYSMQGGFNDIKIRRSVHDIMDTGYIKFPAFSRVNGDDSNLPQSSIETAKLFKEGDKVLIQLGYNKELKTEFEGFVRRVNPGTPITLDLEGYGWQLRRKYINKSWKSTSVRKVLEELVKGTDITLSKDIPDIPLTKFTIPNSNGLEVLEYFKDKLHLSCHFTGSVLYVGIEQGVVKGEVKYRLGWNVIKDNQLKYRLAEDTRVLVRVLRKLKKGEKILYETGDQDGGIYKIKLPNVGLESDCKRIGDEALKKAKYTGYEGKIASFLQPYCEPSYKAVLDDVRFGDRSGSFFVAATEVRCNMRGGRRIVEISRKLNV